MKTLKAFDIFVSNNGKVSCKTIQANNETEAMAQVEGTIVKVVDLGLVGEWGNEVEEVTQETKKTLLVNIMDLKVGMIVDFYEARFQILDTKIIQMDGQSVMVAHGKWLEGCIMTGYFGPDQDWTFQGNRFVSYYVENI